MLDELVVEYNKLQKKYGDPSLDSITFGGCKKNPDICFVFMNPTARNITASKEWTGIKSPWVGTKNVWGFFQKIGFIDEEMLYVNRVVGKMQPYGLKVLGKGEITKPFTVRASKFSKSAIEKIEKAGGKVEVI